ncbi:NUDIX hydrolase [Nocardia sp. KC 131]|uniref:NUDIX hydrolase n=1 Tax=Nocardia arseniciresistens TaxID=3392119 RepID=UPI00398F8802
MTLVLNDLLMYRHRFIIDRWVWELPGGYVDHAEDVAIAAAREVEEETGWRPKTMEHLVSFQPSIGTLDQPQEIYLARGADLTDTPPDINEAEDVRWIPLEDAVAMIDRSETSIIPGPVHGTHGPAEPAAVTFELSGPHSDEFRQAIAEHS